MWEQTLIESKGNGRHSNRWWTIPTAATLHVVLILSAILASYWRVEAVEAPSTPMAYMTVIPLVIGPPPARGGGAVQQKSVEATKPVEVNQPVEIPPTIVKSPIASENFVPDGSDAGDPNAPPGPGSPDGVLGGVGDKPFGNDVVGEFSDEPVVITPDVQQPVLLKRVEPEYPRAAQITRSEGMVILEAVITKKGDVEGIRILRSDNSLLEKAAVDAVLQWKYKPATVQGRPVKVYFTVTVRFHMR